MARTWPLGMDRLVFGLRSRRCFTNVKSNAVGFTRLSMAPKRKPREHELKRQALLKYLWVAFPNEGEFSGMGRSSMDNNKRMEDSKDEHSSIRMPSLHPVIPMRVTLQRCPLPFDWTTMEYAYANLESMFNQNFITCLNCPCLVNSN